MQPLLRLLPLLATLQALTIIEQSLHKLHRPPSANHAEVPERLESAKAALLASDVKVKAWRNAVNSTTCTVFDAVDALKLVHDVEHLREVQAMSQTGGGFDTDTYCAPGSWEAVLDGTRAWADAVALAVDDEGPAFALSRPAGHHATRTTAMGFGLVNYACAAVSKALEGGASTAAWKSKFGRATSGVTKVYAIFPHRSAVSILDWDVHHGNGVAAIFGQEPRVRYCSIHEAGGFPGTGQDESDRGALGNILNLPLPKGSGSDEYFAALRDKALPFLLDPEPDCLLVCSGYDALEPDPLATMTLQPSDFAQSVDAILARYPRTRVALGLEGGYSLGAGGMPEAFTETCRALVDGA